MAVSFAWNWLPFRSNYQFSVVCRGIVAFTSFNCVYIFAEIPLLKQASIPTARPVNAFKHYL